MGGASPENMKKAAELGWRHLNVAHAYGSLKHNTEGLKKVFESVPREEMFISAKCLCYGDSLAIPTGIPELLVKA